MGLEIMNYTFADGLDAFETIHPTVTRCMDGINGVSMHGPFDGLVYLTRDPLLIEVTMKRFIQSINAASFHKVKHLVFHSGYRSFFGANAGLQDLFISHSIKFWKDFEKYIPDGTTVYIENVEDENPEIFLRVIQGVNSPKVRCCFDIGHAYVYSPVPLDKWVSILGKYIGHIYINDNDGKYDRHFPLGKGNIPLFDVINCLFKYVGEEVPFVLECDVSASIEWLKDKKFIG